jgi:tetratricopeptide (TPR) repeat protein
MLLGTFLVFLTLLLVVVVIVVGVIAYLKLQPSGVVALPPEPPGWVLKEPPGLPPQRVSALFEQGQAKMKANDRRGALLDFYRALRADPASLYVDKFAFAAGEYLVLDELQKEFAVRAAEKRDRLTKRDRLLAELRSGNRTRALAAETILKREFKTDPVVVERLELPLSESVQAIERVRLAASERMAAGKSDEASELLRKALAEAEDPKVRAETLASLRIAQKDVARASHPLWTEAVVLGRTDRAAAEAKFRELAAAHPSNLSAQVHLVRLK